MENFDLVVIGGGPGGYVAAIRAAQLGMQTALVESSHLGGVCLNWGCIPTKALLQSAELYSRMNRAGDFGLKAGNIGYDSAAMVKRARGVAERLSKGVTHLLKKNGVRVYEGRGRLKSAHVVEVSEGEENITELSAPHVILATGARPRPLPDVQPDGDRIWTSREAVFPEKLPSSLLVIGAGAIGMEFASFYATFGTKVTLVEAAERVLPVEDSEISEYVRKAFTKRGIEIWTGAKVTGTSSGKNDITAEVTDSDGKIRKVKAERILLAAGITGNVEDMGLEDLDVEVERGHIKVNRYGRTAEKGVYAIGDVAGPPWLAHKASHEGVICVERIAGRREPLPLEPLKIPACTYCTPQVASMGLTEEKAREVAGEHLKVGSFPFQANGKALAQGEGEGVVKTLFNAKTGELLGVHMTGPEVTELVQGFSIASVLETTEAELMRTVFPHPTLSEAIHESVLSAYGEAIHI